ncbi:MAG: cation transporter [Chloroflexi bacterium HGW-Chloroflexi-6]|nr:MAG: cation transporter [Chloroflexi bacterium HGW-Chloroflexi-6]
MIWIEFIVCAALLIWAATLLSKYGDVLAVKTGLGRAWVGAILIAGVTSLPELASGVSAVAWLKAPNLAAGAILGSCLFNLALIAMMDLAYQPGRILSKAHDGHILSAGLGILLLGMVAMGVLIGSQYNSIGLPGFSLLSILLLVIYVFGGRMISTVEQARQVEVLEKEAEAEGYAHISARKSYLIFIVSALAVVGLGIWLASIGDRISATTGLSRSFVGNLFLATSTSLPEIAASLAAIRIGAIDMAIANVLGSNLFNIAILAIYDIADGKANFWASLNDANGFAAVIVMMMTGVVIISLMYRVSPKTPYRFSWDGISLSIMYIGAMVMLYFLG